MATYTPSNFAFIAGDELCGPQKIPCAFGYYAETDTELEILQSPTDGHSFFGLRTDGSGLPLTPAEKLLPSASPHLTRGSLILINGKSISGSPVVPSIDPFVLYVIITSEAGEDTTYDRIFHFP